MNKKSMLTTAFATAATMNLSAVASDDIAESAQSHDNLDAGKNITGAKTNQGFDHEGGLLGSGFCCADCREWDKS